MVLAARDYITALGRKSDNDSQRDGTTQNIVDVVRKARRLPLIAQAIMFGGTLLMATAVLAQAPPTWNGTGEHPLTPVLRWAQQGLPAIESLKDYSAVLVRRERVRGQLSGYEYMFVKIRHAPFSVYGRFQSPASVKGQEVIYIAARIRATCWPMRPVCRDRYRFIRTG